MTKRKVLRNPAFCTKARLKPDRLCQSIGFLYAPYLGFLVGLGGLPEFPPPVFPPPVLLLGVFEGLTCPAGVLVLTLVGASVAGAEPPEDPGVMVPPASPVAVSVPLIGKVVDSVIVPVAEIVGVLVAVAVDVEVEVDVAVVVRFGSSVGVAVEADWAEGVLACMAMPMRTPINIRSGTPTMTRARLQRLGRGEVAGMATGSAVKSVVRVASTRYGRRARFNAACISAAVTNRLARSISIARKITCSTAGEIWALV